MGELGIAGLLVEVVGDADGHLAASEKQGGFEEEGRLVMEKMLPPLGRQKFG
jgi:hypothetical protein